VTLPVGDLKGQLRSPRGGAPWITDRDTIFPNGVPSQTRWVYDSDLTQGEYDATEKTELREGFRDSYKRAQKPGLAAAVGATLLLVTGAFWLTRRH
jgi:hypothetical protein